MLYMKGCSVVIVSVLNEPILNKNTSDSDSFFLDSLNNAAIVLNQQGHICHLNTAFLNEPSFKDQDITVGMSIIDLFPLFTDHFTFPMPPTKEAYVLDILWKHQTKRFHFHPFVWPEQHLCILSTNEREDLLKIVLDSIPARVFWKDVNSRYLGSNQLFANDCGVGCSDDLIGKEDYDYFPKKESESFRADDRQVMDSGTAKLNIEEPQTRRDGSISWLQTSKVPIRDKTGNIIGIMGSYTDITERVQYRQLIEKQAHYDYLTGLANRLALKSKIEKINKSDSYFGGGLLFIDLDQFKTVNDSLGHKVGDELLIEVAKRIEATVADRGFLCRLGGDEFALLVLFKEYIPMDTSFLKLKKIASDIRSAIINPYQIFSHHIQLGVSIGITQCSQDHVFCSDQLNEADIAMYEAKAIGRNAIQFYDDAMQKKVNHVHTIQSRLGFAIEQEELYLDIQPQYNQNDEWVGGEALLRWKNKDLGQISPVEFIPISEQTGIIHDIGIWVFEQSFKMVHQWMKKYDRKKLKPLSINVSAKQFESRDFIHLIKSLMRHIPIDPTLIEFELTESLLFSNEDNALMKLSVLKELGFILAIDDFGTGYSCLSYVSKLPMDILKIDRSFINQIHEDERQASIVETIIAMAKNLHLEAVAEGVETLEQKDFLISKGCHQFQGYYFSRPIAFDDYDQLVAKNVGN